LRTTIVIKWWQEDCCYNIITCTIKAIDVGKMVKLKYEATTNLSLLATFVVFVTFSSHPTIGKE